MKYDGDSCIWILLYFEKVEIFGISQSFGEENGIFVRGGENGISSSDIWNQNYKCRTLSYTSGIILLKFSMYDNYP